MKFLLNIFFPKFCIGCKKIGRSICSSCYQEMVFIQKQMCPYCKKVSMYGYTHEACKAEKGIEGAMSLLEYQGITKKFIKDIKYQRIFSELEDFFLLLPSCKKEEVIKNISLYQIDYILPIPLHKQKQKIRGFNQAEKIAEYIAKYIKVPVIDILDRQKNTSPQAQIKKKQDREVNIKNAFKYKGKSEHIGKNILLIDDLFTTGSTTKEATKELKEKGIKDVFVFTLAHG